MKDQDPKITGKQQGQPTSDRANHDVKSDKKIMGIPNSGGQRSDQTSNKDTEGKGKKQ